MLAGATQRSDSDPYDTASPPISVGSHWMIMWPFDPNTTGCAIGAIGAKTTLQIKK
jgi:hypothetical protein